MNDSAGNNRYKKLAEASFVNEYSQIFTNYSNRPKKINGFINYRYLNLKSHIKMLKDAKKSGVKIVASLSRYIFKELVLSSGAILVGINNDFNFREVTPNENKNCALCDPIASTVAVLNYDLCIYAKLADLIVIDNCCAYFKNCILLNNIDNNKIYTINLPVQGKENKEKTYQEYNRFKYVLENITQNQISFQKLYNSMKTINKKRNIMKKINSIAANSDPVLISGMDGIIIHQAYNYDDPYKFNRNALYMLCELYKRKKCCVGAKPKDSLRVIVLGSCPSCLNSFWKINWIVETTGAVVVGNYSVYSNLDIFKLKRCTDNNLDELIGIAYDYYKNIMKIETAESNKMIGNLLDLIESLKVDLIINVNMKGCKKESKINYVISDRATKKNLDILTIETDFSFRGAEKILKKLAELNTHNECNKYNQKNILGYGKFKVIHLW